MLKCLNYISFVVLLDAAQAKECCITRGHTGDRRFKVLEGFQVLEFSQSFGVLLGVESR